MISPCWLSHACVHIKHLTTKSLKTEAWFAAFSNFHGVNTPTVADFKLLPLNTDLGRDMLLPSSPPQRGLCTEDPKLETASEGTILRAAGWGWSHQRTHKLCFVSWALVNTFPLPPSPHRAGLRWSCAGIWWLKWPRAHLPPHHSPKATDLWCIVNTSWIGKLCSKDTTVVWSLWNKAIYSTSIKHSTGVQIFFVEGQVGLHHAGSKRHLKKLGIFFLQLYKGILCKT